MAGLELLLEAERRGILPADRQAALDEARRRGLVPAAQPAAPAPIPEPQGMPADERRSLPLAVTPSAQTGAYLQDRLTQGASNLVGLPRAAQDLTMAGIEKALGALGVDVTPESLETFRKVSGFPFSMIPQDPAGELQERTGFDPFTGAQPQSTTEINVGDFLEGAASFPFSPGGAVVAGASNVTGQGSRRMAENLGAGETGQTIAQLAGGAAGGMGTGLLQAAPAAIRGTSPAAPTLEALRKQAKKAYKRAEQAGAVVKQPRFNSFVQSLSARVAREGIDPDIHKGATAALKRLQSEAGAAPSLEQLDTLRRVVRDAGKSGSPSDLRMSAIMTEQLDKFVDRLKRVDLVAGDSRKAIKAFRQGRDLWRRNKKGEVIEDLIDRAGLSASSFSGSGFENALRTEFRNLAKNPKRLKGFKPEEVKAIRRVAMGGPLQNVLRFFGKAAPTGIVSGALGPGLGAAVAGPAGAVAVPLVGGASRAGATALTKGAAKAASELVRRGGPAPPSQGRKILQRALAESLAPTAAAQTGGRPRP